MPMAWESLFPASQKLGSKIDWDLLLYFYTRNIVRERGGFSG